MSRVGLLMLAALLSLGSTDSKVAAGAYCPLPKGDEPPACLTPATREYEKFFSGLREGKLDDSALAEVEQDLGGEDRYQALSALVYAYWLLSERSVGGESTDPELSNRLEHWNTLIGESYHTTSDAEFREALQLAVADLQNRAPAIPVRCTDRDGNITQCHSTDAVAEAITDVRDRTGIRGAVGRLLNRLLGGSN